MKFESRNTPTVDAVLYTGYNGSEACDAVGTWFVSVDGHGSLIAGSTFSVLIVRIGHWLVKDDQGLCEMTPADFYQKYKPAS